MAAAAPAGIRWLEQTPEPARFWIRWRPRGWPAPPYGWTDLAAGALGDPGPPWTASAVEGELRPSHADDRPEGSRAGRGEEPPVAAAFAPPPSPLDDTVWLPPVPAALEPERLRLAEHLGRAGTPVLVQLAVTGDEAAATPSTDRSVLLAATGAAVLLDPLPALLATGIDGALRALAVVAREAAAAAVWPLVAGLGDSEDDAVRAAEALAAAGFAAVQPLALGLTPGQRRRLAEAGGAGFDDLFHRPPPEERPFARAVAAAGPSPFLSRPLPRPPVRGGETRRLAGLLALAGELWLRCGRAPEAGHALLRAARWADAAGYDLGALAREGNLGVVTALDARSRELLAEAAAGAEPRLVRELLAEYAGAAPGAGAAGARRTEHEEVWDG